MRLTVSLLLVAGCTCVAASAGELPVGRGTNIAKSAACASYGPGFVAVAGSESCVRVSGHVRVEFGWGKGATAPSRGGDGASSAYTAPSPPLSSSEAGFVFGRLKPAAKPVQGKPRVPTQVLP